MRAVVSKYSKLTPVERAALLMAPVICDAKELATDSTDMKSLSARPAQSRAGCKRITRLKTALAGPKGFVLIDAVTRQALPILGIYGKRGVNGGGHERHDPAAQARRALF